MVRPVNALAGIAVMRLYDKSLHAMEGKSETHASTADRTKVKISKELLIQPRQYVEAGKISTCERCNVVIVD